MSSKGGAPGGSGMTYGSDSQSGLQPMKRADRGLAGDAYKPLYSSSLRSSGQAAMDKPTYKPEGQQISIGDKPSQGVFNPRLSRYGVFNNMTLPKGPTAGPAQVSSGTTQL
jgi:hypothetical protein